MNSKTNPLKVSLIKGTIIAIIIHFGSLSYAQNYDWELDKYKSKEQEKKEKLDSILVHLKNHWQISLSYGRWHFANSAQSKEESLLEFPQNMGTWSLSGARYLSEHVFVNANVGILVRKVEPLRPDIFSVINGANIEIEGGGIVLLPVSLGMDYFFLKQRFRPYAGFGVGAVLARNKYVKASGNISNGINRDEYEFSSSATFVELSSGLIYRTGEKAQLGLNFDYLQSKDFSENIGGYKAYSGINVSVFFSVVF